MESENQPGAPRVRGGRRKGSGKRADADAPWELRAIQALADPSRWRITRFLTTTEASVSEIAREVGLSVACTSRHISILIESNLIESRREGRSTRCRAAVLDARGRTLLDTLGFEQVAGAGGARVRAEPGDAEPPDAIPEFSPSRSRQTRQYVSKEIDDFLL